MFGSCREGRLKCIRARSEDATGNVLKALGRQAMRIGLGFVARRLRIVLDVASVADERGRKGYPTRAAGWMKPLERGQDSGANLLYIIGRGW
jgi:hypothetical protein